jgi:hypothetical protein
MPRVNATDRSVWRQLSRAHFSVLRHFSGELSEELVCGAGDGTRTHDILLGKQTLYQLSYTRIASSISLSGSQVQTTWPNEMASEFGPFVV